MTMHVRKLCVVLAVLIAAAFSAISARADWFYDFSGGAIPDTFERAGFKSLSMPLQPSWSLQSTLEGGFVKCWDTVPPSQGGTWAALGFNREVFQGDVRVSAEINPLLTHSFGSMGVCARNTPGMYGC